jgi:DtxR family Mn-dependent transcriptional regulator
MTLTEQNYIKAIFHLSTENGQVSVLDLSKFLEIKMPTVTSMANKLATKDLLIYEKYRPLELTQKGKLEAGQIIRKHRLVEMFLVEKMGFDWDEVHTIAEQMEHIDSDVFFNRIDELLEFPKFDPHGSPIPDRKGHIELPNFIKLNEAKKNEKLRFVSVALSADGFLKQIDKHGLKLGDEIVIMDEMEFDRTIIIQINDKKIENLSSLMAENILVLPA